MENRTLDINVISAKGLKDVNLISKMDVYVVVEIAGDPYNHKQKTKTKVDHDGGKNPAWNFPMKFTVLESALQQNHLTLVFKLRCDRVLGDVDIGEVVVPIKELFDSAGDGSKPGMKMATYQVRKPSGKGKGELTFSFKFNDLFKGQAAAVPPPAIVTAYPVLAEPSPSFKGEASAPPPGYPPPAYPPAGYPPPPTGYAPPHAGYPPPPVGAAGYPPVGAAGYPPPPPHGYGYPPPPPYGGYAQPPPGYGYAPPPLGYGYQQAPPKKNKFGLGLGAGLLGGALGGLLIGDMVSDAGSYDAGYDAGFDDAGGF